MCIRPLSSIIMCSPTRSSNSVIKLLIIIGLFMTLTIAVSLPSHSSSNKASTSPSSITLDKQLIILTSSRGVDDVGPALANATQIALQHANYILSNYSSVLHGVAIPSGLAVTFFGYFLLGPVLFLAAFITGGGASFIAVKTVLQDIAIVGPSSAWASILAMLLGGALFGFLAMRALPIGMFTVGAALGIIFASTLRTTLIPQLYPKDPQTVFIITVVSLGLILGLLALLFQRHMLIFSTAYAGACASVFGIGHFEGHFPTANDLAQIPKGEIDIWLFIYFIITIILGTIGMLFQFWLGADKKMPKYAPYDRRRRPVIVRPRRKYRYVDEEEDFDEGDDWDGAYVEHVPLSSKNKRERRVVSPIHVVAPQQQQQQQQQQEKQKQVQKQDEQPKA